MMSRKRFKSAFTIVELLVIVIVVGILAISVVVGYNGLSKQAIRSTMHGDLNTTSKLAEVYKVENGGYPLYLEEIINGNPGFSASGDNKITYINSGDKYCIEVSNPRIADPARSTTYQGGQVCSSSDVPQFSIKSSSYTEGASCGRRNFVASDDLTVLIARCNSGPYYYSYSLNGGETWVRASSIASYSNGQVFAISGDGLKAYSGFHSNSNDSSKYCLYSSTRTSSSSSIYFSSISSTCNGAQTFAIDKTGGTVLKGGAYIGQHAQLKTPDSPSWVNVNALGGANNGGHTTGAAVSGNGKVCALISKNSGNVGISTKDCKTWTGMSSRLCGIASDDLYMSYDGSKVVLFGRSENSSRQLKLYLREKKICISINPLETPAPLTYFTMSDDGLKMAAISSAQLYLSDNGGSSWFRAAEDCDQISSPVIASDGLKIGAVCTKSGTSTYSVADW